MFSPMAGEQQVLFKSEEKQKSFLVLLFGLSVCSIQEAVCSKKNAFHASTVCTR